MGLNFSIWIFLLGLALVGVAFWAYRRTTPEPPPGLRVILIALRVLAFSLLVLLLMDPRYVFRSDKNEPPHVIALIDQSASMSLPVSGWQDGASPQRLERALDIADDLRDAIRDRDARYSELFFSNNIHDQIRDSVLADGQGTDIVQAVASAFKANEGENIAAFVVLSDGVNTEDALVRRGLPNVPVFTVGVGDTSAPEDVRIQDVDYNRIVRTPARTSIKATLHYSGDGAKRVKLRLREDNRVIFEKDTVLTASARDLAQEITVEFKKPGRRQFALEAEVAGGDVELANNQRDIIIEGEKAGVKILIVDIRPTWELHFLTHLLRADQTFDFDLVASLGDHPSLRDGRFKSPSRFVELLGDYDALVLSSVTNEFLSDEVAAVIRRYVEDEGRGLLVLPGASSLFEVAPAWNRLSDILPVNGAPPHRFNLQFTSVRPGAQAGTNPITADLIPLFNQGDWQQRTPLLGFYGQISPKSNVEILLETSDRNTPAFAYQDVGKGRVALMSAGPIWRWKFLAEDNTLYDEMLSRLFDVLTRGENSERFVLQTRKNVYDSGEAPVVTAEIFNEKMQPVTGVPVRAELIRIDENGAEVPLEIISMQRESDGSRFETTLPTLPPGAYRLKGESEIRGRTVSSPPVDFSVSNVSVEYQQVAQDRENLMAIAGRSGGVYVNASAVEQLFEQIGLKKRVVETTVETSLRASRVVFAFLILVLAAEWLLRKRAGMI